MNSSFPACSRGNKDAVTAAAAGTLRILPALFPGTSGRTTHPVSDVVSFLVTLEVPAAVCVVLADEALADTFDALTFLQESEQSNWSV